jgi:hypothetical protein
VQQKPNPITPQIPDVQSSFSLQGPVATLAEQTPELQ